MNIVSFGGGTNSAALLIGLYKHKIPIDLITFADTGAEHPHTYQFIEIINQWLARYAAARLRRAATGRNTAPIARQRYAADRKPKARETGVYG